MILIDAKAAMHHSYHIGSDPDAVLSALGNDINTAEFGFNNFMERYMLPILEDDCPNDILIAHDAGTAFRSAILPEYKKTKSRTEQDPEERVQQARMFEMMKRYWAAIGCTQAKVEGVEADDLLAYFCQKLPGNHDVYTVDVDLMQLQADYPNVQVLLKCEYQTTVEHKGIPYSHTSIAKSMIGDKSDNYGGIYGFGRSKWDGLVEAYGYDGIDELAECVETKNYTALLEAIQETGDKTLVMLYEKRSEWRKGWELAKLRPELCWKPNASKKLITKIDWFKRVPSYMEVKKIFKAMSCQDLLDDPRLYQWYPVQWLLTPEEVDDALFSEFAAECKKSPFVAFDYETYPSKNAMATNPKGKEFVDPKEALIAGASFTFGENLSTTFYLPVEHADTDNVNIKVLARLLAIADKQSTLVAQNASFELSVTKANLDFWLGRVIDTRLMQYYVDENEEAHLKEMSQRLLGYRQATYEETVWSEEEQRMRTMDELTGEEVVSYGCDDAIVTASICSLFTLIMHIEGTYDFFMENQTLSQHSLVDAYLKGVDIDWEALKIQTEKDAKTVEDSDKRLRELLEEHCSSPDAKAAKTYTASIADYVKAKARSGALAKLAKSKSDMTDEDAEAVKEAVAEALHKVQSDALRATMYEPYIEVEEPVKFVPTPLQFKEVIENLEFPQPAFASVSRKAISEWLSEVTALDFDAPKSESALTPLQETFCRLLGEACDQISKRTGQEYEDLVAFCAKNSSRKGKISCRGDELNTGSPAQMQYLLYCKLGLPVRLTGRVEKGSKRDELNIRDGSPQTNALAIDTAMAEDTKEGDWKREAALCIKAIKESKTRASLYHDSYPLWKHPSDGRIHPQIKDCGTVTRRPSGSSPNILQVSKHQQDGVMRSIFIPRSKQEVIVSIDFSQQELRIMASESGDANLISCYIGENRRDVHSLTASGIAKVGYDDFMEAYSDKDHARHKELVAVRKRPAKQTNFLFAYLGEAHTLSQRLIIPFAEADAMMNAAYTTYPQVQPWQAREIAFARANGYTETAYGNRRHIGPEIFSDDNSENSRMQRQAVNAVIQGGAADILKIVLTQCWETNLWEETRSTLIAPVYDEITASVPVSTAEEYIVRLSDIMEITPPGHVVPMEADVSLGANWRDQIELGVRPSSKVVRAALQEISNGR